MHQERLRPSWGAAREWLAVLALASSPAQLGTADARAAGSPAPPSSPPELAPRFARLALDCVSLEYPNKIAHVLQGDADVRPPRELTPAFFGCYDWHSAVHAHWLLARLLFLDSNTPYAGAARAALAASLTPEKIATEARYLAAPGRAAFERPYGLAWLLRLAAELRARSSESPAAASWLAALRPLEETAVARLREWIPKLSYPIREGEHDQTAFAFAQVLDWATIAGDRVTHDLLVEKIQILYLDDRACPLAYEPSGQDFLSPCLGEADLVRRILPPREFATWLSEFLPGISRDGSARWLPVAKSTDPGDPKLAHLDGLNLSRAWMLAGIAGGLPAEDPRLPSLRAIAAAHREAGLAAVTGEHYEGGHWLGTFAVYLVTEAGLPADGGDRTPAPPDD